MAIRTFLAAVPLCAAALCGCASDRFTSEATTEPLSDAPPPRTVTIEVMGAW